MINDIIKVWSDDLLSEHGVTCLEDLPEHIVVSEIDEHLGTMQNMLIVRDYDYLLAHNRFIKMLISLLEE